MCGFSAMDGDLKPHLRSHHPGFLAPTEGERAAQRTANEAARGAAAASAREARHAAYLEAQRECPLPVVEEARALPGGLQLLTDEFFVLAGKDWGWSSQRLTLTTHRVIYSRGRLTKDQQIVYLTDVRDVRFHKPLVGFGTLALETAGGLSIEGLPAASGGATIRDTLLQLVHFARLRASRPALTSASAASPSSDKYEQLKKLGELRQSGVLTDAEFEAEKKKLLSSQ